MLFSTGFFRFQGKSLARKRRVGVVFLLGGANAGIAHDQAAPLDWSGACRGRGASLGHAHAASFGV